METVQDDDLFKAMEEIEKSLPNKKPKTEKKPKIEGFDTEDHYIDKDRLQELYDYYKDDIERLKVNHKGDGIWWNCEIKARCLRLSEKNCVKAFGVFIGRLEKHDPYPLEDLTKFFGRVLRSLEKPIFLSDLIQEVIMCTEQFPQSSAIQGNIELIYSLLNFKRPVVEQIFKTYKEALAKDDGNYVKFPVNYLKAIVKQGKEDGRWDCLNNQ